MLSRQLEVSLRLAVSMARQKRHEFLTVEHLLLALLDNDSAVNALKACGADIIVLRKELEDYVEQHTPKLAENSDQAPHPTESFDRILQRAIFHVQSSGGDRTVEGADILVAMYSERDSFAVYLLKRHQINRLTLTQYLSHGTRKDDVPSEEEIEELEGESASSANSGPLELYTTNLNVEAQRGKTDPLIGREKEIERAAQILCRRRKNNPLLVGDPGVGKTSIAEGLAWLIVNGKAPKPLENAEIFSLDIGALVAGTKYRGDFEKRLKQLLNALKKKPEAILFIDEIHMIIGAGSSMGSTMDASNLIKPALANGSLRCIGSTTFQEYRQVFEKDHALSRRFQKIDVNEPSISETIDILRGLKSKFEDFHHVQYDDQALVSAVELSAKFINDRFLPDKAIDVIDEAGAQRRLKAEQDNSPITVENIEDIISKIARIPPKTVSKDDKTVLENLERDLKRVVFGQDEAIEALASAIKLSRAGLKSPDKPVGSFVFAGPTGVGKTEVTKQLAKLMGVELVRFDMSEYMERHAVSRLIGAPPGYVGFDQGGLLTDAIHKHPHCVLLLDEIEKAHPDVFNLLLQIMDHGSLTDNNGRKSDFRNVVLVLTTNIGAESISRVSIGFMEQDNSNDNQEAMKKAFSPEFRNRLDGVIQFKALATTVIENVVDKFLTELQAQLDEKKVILDVDHSAREWMAEHGYDRLMGARPMQRLIQEHLKKPLAEMILFGELAENGGNVAVSVKKEDGKAVGLKIEVFEDQTAEPA
ncbi:ATP-dependent Clp protease ATP-binding subunit ClpA [Acinetobacter bohemicus]|uniref:ATP-dependent Clp protease ATP-binding subunit ClpA n=1 Tax=Acinetobacter TaxID=469 RepID=UPI00157D2FDB|nr:MULTISPECIES: ATP-dependent Clp protease ATP-binding subunit ClpA [Acinetobacter]MCO8042801.1 ATP-dependent Clp protease ATP-binding subunit ClpA [Acinetobacter sp. S4400-12]MCU7225136.1 ATP-dependent Clp protease ATP-binding subunit ClpA [Acinetobacter bohemicus]MDM1782100.1 ATP-dependent Clp protease ATP-binding subunit ClpA [Acinetobacter indicus]QKQ70144.1 ATP-dependent Clp protease ATP-binding subunit ClpA [Acinetobacter sp. 10FS3-1]